MGVKQKQKQVSPNHTSLVHAELRRSNLQEVWGLTWLRSAFNERRRVLEAVDPDTPAGRWNAERVAGGNRPLRPFDELKLVNGSSDWDEMGRLRELLVASLSFAPCDSES